YAGGTGGAIPPSFGSDTRRCLTFPLATPPKLSILAASIPPVHDRGCGGPDVPKHGRAGGSPFCQSGVCAWRRLSGWVHGNVVPASPDDWPDRGAKSRRSPAGGRCERRDPTRSQSTVARHRVIAATSGRPERRTCLRLPRPGFNVPQEDCMSRHPRPITIVVADDDPDDRMMVEEAFQENRLKNTLVFVENGEELIDCLRGEG